MGSPPLDFESSASTYFTTPAKLTQYVSLKISKVNFCKASNFFAFFYISHKIFSFFSLGKNEACYTSPQDSGSGGNSGNGGSSSGSSECSGSDFRCKNSGLSQRCWDGAWVNFEECVDGKKCDSASGRCKNTEYRNLRILPAEFDLFSGGTKVRECSLLNDDGQLSGNKPGSDESAVKMLRMPCR